MKHGIRTILWELWAALCLCAVLVLPPGSGWLHEPAVLGPGLALAVFVPAAWALWGLWADLPEPLPPECPVEPVQPFDFATLCDLPAAVP